MANPSVSSRTLWGCSTGADPRRPGFYFDYSIGASPEGPSFLAPALPGPMQDAITNVINQSDVQGLYLEIQIGRLSSISPAEQSVRAAATMFNASAIIKKPLLKPLLYSDSPRPAATCTRPTLRRCIRD